MPKSSLKGAAIATAVAAAMAAAVAGNLATPGHAQAAGKKVKCEGANHCKGQSECKGADHTCKAKNECRGTGFTHENDRAACEKAGGKVVVE